MKFHITIERDEDGRYVAECTDLPGCFWETKEAIIGCLKSRLKIAGGEAQVPTHRPKARYLHRCHRLGMGYGEPVGQAPIFPQTKNQTK
jgi:hypothetical protein